MAITAHWITAATSTQDPARHAKLMLRADLIGFIHVPGRHTGEHLAHTFLYALDCICHRQIFRRETLSDLTAKSSAIEMKRGLRVLCDVYSQDSVAL
jgi:hypothetical protein